MQQRFTGPGKFRAQRGHGVSLDGRASREADVEQLAHRGARSVAAHQVTAAPPGVLGPARVGGQPARVLLQGVELALDRDLDEPFIGDGGAQGAGQHMLRHMQRRRRLITERELPHQLLAAQRTPARPPRARLHVTERVTGEPLHEGRGVIAQDDGPRGPLLVLAGPFVEHDGGYGVTRESQGEREPRGPSADNDHRVHGAHSPVTRARESWTYVQELTVGARCTITERMQPIAGACVK